MDAARPRRDRTGRGRGAPLNADPAAQLRLLEVQALDLRLDQLAHRRRTLPQIAELESVAAEHSRLRDLEVATETELSDLERERQRADADVEQVRARKARDRQRLDAGTVSSARELTSLQSEIASLDRRQAELEEVELELMERIEEGQRRLATLVADRARAAEQAGRLQQVRDGEWERLDREAEDVRVRRASLAASLPADLLGLYDKLRPQLRGVAAAALRGRRCDGCHLELDAADLARIRSAAPDTVVRCEECRRILVRTPESGL